jgi:hypothetical protein
LERKDDQRQVELALREESNEVAAAAFFDEDVDAGIGRAKSVERVGQQHGDRLGVAPSRSRPRAKPTSSRPVRSSCATTPDSRATSVRPRHQDTVPIATSSWFMLSTSRGSASPERHRTRFSGSVCSVGHWRERPWSVRTTGEAIESIARRLLEPAA